MSFEFSKKTGSKTVLIWMMWLFLLCPGTRGQARPDESMPPLPPQVTIRIDSHPNSATVGDPIRLDMEITLPPGYQAEISRPATQSGDFYITDFSSERIPAQSNKPRGAAMPASNQVNSLAHQRTQVTVAIYKTGKFVFPAIPVKIKTPDGKEIAAASPPVKIEIRSVLTEKDPRLKDLKKQAEIPEPVRWLLWITLVAAGALMCGLVWYFWRRRHRQPVPLTPAQTQDMLDAAEKNLRDLLARGIPESGMEKQFYIALSEIVKRILEAGYQIHTAEQTTSEIMDALHDRPGLDSANMGQIESFLTRCDVVKFAKYVPARDEHETTSQDALRILAEARVAVVSRQPLVGSH